MKCLEDRMNIKVIEQREELNVEKQEVDDRMILRKMEETDWVKEYVDNTMTQRIKVVKSGMSDIRRQFDRRFKKIDEIEARNSKLYYTVEDKISECVINSTVASMERKINEIEDKVEVITK